MDILDDNTEVAFTLLGYDLIPGRNYVIRYSYQFCHILSYDSGTCKTILFEDDARYFINERSVWSFVGYIEILVGRRCIFFSQEGGGSHYAMFEYNNGYDFIVERA